MCVPRGTRVDHHRSSKARRRSMGVSVLACAFLPITAVAQSSAITHLESQPAAFASVSDSVLRDAVLRSSQELAARHFALRAAETRATAAGSRPATILTGEADEVPNGIDLPGAGSLRFDLEQELMGRSIRAAMKSVAASEIEIARAAIVATERRLLAALDRNLIRLSGWSAISRRLAAEDELFSSAEVSLRGRFAAGDARYVDVLRLRTERLRAQGDRAAAVTEAGAARVAILGLAGAGESSSVVTAALNAVTTAEPSFTLAPIVGVDSLLALSGALHLSRAQVVRAEAARRLALAEQSRRITASFGAQRFQKENGGYSFGPAVSLSTTLPFTARKANRARAAAAGFAQQTEEAEQRGNLASIRSSLSIAAARYEAARNRLGVYDAAVLRGAREERESALASFRSGDLSLAELLDFERALSRAEVDRIKTRIEASDALSDVFGAIHERVQIMSGSNR